MATDRERPVGATDGVRQVAAVVERRWFPVLLAVALLAHAVTVWRVHGGGGRPPLQDSMILEYGGWFVSRGATLYVEFWDLKPPLAYWTPASLAVLPVDVRTYHLLAVAVTVGAAVGCVLVVGGLVHRVTGDGLAALAAGLVPLSMGAFPLRAAVGYKPKYFVALFGLLGVYLALRDRPLAAGAAAAASAGYWQLAAVFPPVALALAWQRGGRRALGRGVAGASVVTALVLAPVVFEGATTAMLVEVVVIPLVVGEDGVALGRFRLLLAVLQSSTIPVGIGLVGLGYVGLSGDRHRVQTWWAPALGAWFLGLALAFDLDTYPDAIPLVAVAGVGLGLLVAAADRRVRVPVGTVLAVAVAVSVGFVGGTGIVFGPVDVAEPAPVADAAAVDPPYGSAERRALYWHRIEASSCHVFVGPKQRAWLEMTDRPKVESECGRPPESLSWLAV